MAVAGDNLRGGRQQMMALGSYDLSGRQYLCIVYDLWVILSIIQSSQRCSVVKASQSLSVQTVLGLQGKILSRGTLEQVDVTLVEELLLDGWDFACLDGCRHQRVPRVHRRESVEARKAWALYRRRGRTCCRCQRRQRCD